MSDNAPMNALMVIDTSSTDVAALREATEKKWANNLQLLSEKSQLVINTPEHFKEAPKAGQFWCGTLRAGVDELDRLGKVRSSVLRFIPVATQNHASVIENNELAEESFDVNSDIYRKIKAEAAAKIKGGNRTARVGLDVLMWLPAVKEFGVYFFNGTALEVGLQLLAYMGETDSDGRFINSGKVCAMRSYLKKGTSFSWWTVAADLPAEDPAVLVPAEALPDKSAFEQKLTWFKTRQPRSKQQSISGQDR